MIVAKPLTTTHHPSSPLTTPHNPTQEVTALQFHPNTQQLVSGSKDYTIKIFEYSKPSVKRALKTIHVCLR